jgi:hypothetical protein
VVARRSAESGHELAELPGALLALLGRLTAHAPQCTSQLIARGGDGLRLGAVGLGSALLFLLQAPV